MPLPLCAPSVPFAQLKCAFVRSKKGGRGIFWRLLLFLLGVATVSAAEPMLGEAPVVYRENLEAQLTPLTEILALKGTSSAEGDSGVILLDERLVSVDEEGRSVLVWHFAYKTITEGAIKTNGEETFGFRKGEQKIALMLAETIQPDGTRQPVQPNAVLIQSPQRQAEYSLYDDQAELKVIFPNVRPGSITHGVVVIEDLKTKIPGQMRQSFAWGSSWGVDRMRFRIELPAALAKRTKIVNLGGGVPPLVTTPLSEGRIRHAWSQDLVKGTPYEVNAPPTSQVGPMVKLTTLSSWEDVGRWFAGLVVGRDQPGPELAAQIARWTEGAATREEKIARIHAGVADDVRYVGLELGSADYQPHDCNQVWANRYGDCKDKATLMIAALRQCGIEAGLALLNTRHQGLIDPRAPDYRVFDHVIVAIPEKGGYLFCDPTIGQSLPGQISSGDSGRDVLVVTADKSAWVRTPSADSGQTQHEFDLKLSEAGELTGWYALTAEGLNGASLRDYYGRMEPHDLRSALSAQVRDFFPGADVIDAEVVTSTRGDPFRCRAYFAVPGEVLEAGKAPVLRFPSHEGLLPRVGHSAERRGSFFMDREKLRVQLKLALPPGWRIEQAPTPLQLDTPAFAIRAEWRTGSDQPVGELLLDQRASLVSRDEFGRLYQGVQSVQAWLERPLSLEQGATVAKTEDAASELDFPLMPTVDGQIDLLDKRYPETGNTDLRRRALERVMQYFPRDPNALVRAGGRLAILDWKADQNEAAHARLADLLQKHGEQISPDTRAWAEIYDGLALRDMKQRAEALTRFERVARDEKLTPGRRADAAPYAADILAEKDGAAARALLLEICMLPGGAEAPVQGRLARLHLDAGLDAELTAHLRKLVEERPDSCEQELADLLEQARNWRHAGAADGWNRLVAAVAAVRPQPAAGLQEALHALRTQAAAALLHDRVKTALGEAPFAALLPTEPLGTDVAATSREIDRAVSQKEAVSALQLTLGSLRQQDLGENFFRRLWQAANYADWLQRQDASKIDPTVPGKILDWCAELPPDNDYFVEGQLLRATRLARTGDATGERKVLQGLRNNPDVSTGFHLHLDLRIAASCEAAGDYAGAVEHYRRIEIHATAEDRAASGLLRAVLLHLHQGNDEEALRILAILKTVPDAVLARTTAPAQIRELRTLLETGHAADVWAAGRAWWSDWLAFAAPLGGSATDLATVIPVIEDLEQLGARLGEAKRAKDRTAYYRQLTTLTSAARWMPSLGSELGSLFSTSAEVDTTQATRLRALLIRQLMMPHPRAIENHAERQLQQAIHCIDGGQPAEALRVIAEYRADHPAPHAYAQAMNRLRGLAALAVKQDLEATAAALAADLADTTYTVQRAPAARILSDILIQLGREKDEEEMLRREVAHPAVLADKARHDLLAARLSQLVGERDYAREINTWLKSLDVPWLDHVDPAGLDDPRLHNLDEAIASAAQHFAPVEQAKLHWLAATDLRRAREDREKSVRLLFNQLLQLSPTYTRLNLVVTRTADHPGLDDNTRITAVWVALLVLSDEGRAEDYQRWRAHPYCERFNAGTKKNLARVDRWMAIDRRSAPAILKLAEELTADGLDEFTGQLMGDLFAALVQTGDYAALDAFVEQSGRWRLPADSRFTSAAIKLEFARRVRQAKAFGRVFDRLSEMALARYPTPADGMPAVYRDLRVRPVLAKASPEETRQMCLHLLKERRASRASLDVFGAYLSSLVREPDAVKQIDELFAAAIAAADSDALRQEIIQLFIGHVDTDNPGVREALRRTIAREINPTQNPAAALTAAFFESKIADRLGDTAKAEGVLLGFTDPMAVGLRQLIGLEMQNRRGDLPALRRSVESLPAQVLLSPRTLPISIEAYTKLGMKEELQAARSQARVEVRKHVAQSWAAHDPDSRSLALLLAEVLAEPDLLPPAWAEHLQKNLPGSFERETVAVTRASLLRDWPATLAAATILNRDFPTHYHFYWHRAKAAAELGRKDEAREALTVYLQYSKDEKQYVEAQALAKKLGLKTRK